MLFGEIHSAGPVVGISDVVCELKMTRHRSFCPCGLNTSRSASLTSVRAPEISRPIACQCWLLRRRFSAGPAVIQFPQHRQSQFLSGRGNLSFFVLQRQTEQSAYPLSPRRIAFIILWPPNHAEVYRFVDPAFMCLRFASQTRFSVASPDFEGGAPPCRSCLPGDRHFTTLITTSKRDLANPLEVVPPHPSYIAKLQRKHFSTVTDSMLGRAMTCADPVRVRQSGAEGFHLSRLSSTRRSLPPRSSTVGRCQLRFRVRR